MPLPAHAQPSWQHKGKQLWTKYSFVVRVALGAIGVISCVVYLVLHTHASIASHHEVSHLFDSHWKDSHASGVKPRAAIERKEASNDGGAAVLTGASGQVQKATDYCAADAKGAVGIPNAEFWGDVVRAAVKPGGTGHEAPTAAACCNACASARGCNVWVWCNNPASCGTQCWLKRVGDPSSGAAKPHAKGEGVSWTSGVLDGKDPDVDPAKLPPPDASVTTVALRTAEGDIRLKLMPEWSQDSVDYVRLVAKNHLCSPQCEFYRVEPGFLIQGSLRSFIPPNKVTKKGPKIMEKGEVGWAGGSAGPDFFLYLGDMPAEHFGHDHTVFAVVADEASLKLAEKLVQLPPGPTPPGQMHMLKENLPLDLVVV